MGHIEQWNRDRTGRDAMKSLLVGLCVLAVAQGAAGQLVVFDNSHGPGHEMYDDFIADLTARGYTVEKRSTPLVNNLDADVIVLMPEDAYTSSSTPYTAQEAAWLMEFVDSGKGLFAGLCANIMYWTNITELMDVFGIELGDYISTPAHYDQFIEHDLFVDVQEMGHVFDYCLSLGVSAPSVPVASDNYHDYISLYEGVARSDGGAIWVSQYKMMTAQGMAEYDNLTFLRNAFDWMSGGGNVGNESATWGDVKRLYD
jgi:hypothetical protein